MILLLAGCKETEPVQREVIRPVRVIRVEEAGAHARQTLAGVARASQELALSFRVPGTIDRLEVKRGDQVEKGVLVATLDRKDQSIEVERAAAAVARASAEHRSAQADYERVKLLYADNSVSQSELDAARALEESKRAMLSAERKGLEMARSKLADHRLEAPLDGAIAEVPVAVNENITSGQTVALLNAGEKAEVEVAVPERIIQLFTRGMTAKVRFDSIPGEEFSGVISEVGVSASSGATGFPVRVALDEADDRVRAGMSALVTLQAEKMGNAKKYFLPPGAVLEDTQEQTFVLMARPTEAGFAEVTKQPVTVGEPSTLGLEITGGLEGGELVIVAGLSSLSVGMKVRILANDQPPIAKERLAEGDVGMPFVDGEKGLKAEPASKED